MSLPENVRVDWNTLGDLSSSDLQSFLQNAYKELRIGSNQATALVSVESFLAISKLANDSEVSTLAIDILKCAWNQLGQEDKCFLLARFLEQLPDDSAEMASLKIELSGSFQHERSKAILMTAIKFESVGAKAIPYLQKYSLSGAEFETLTSEVDEVVLLRIIDVASALNIESQKWASSKLLSLLTKSKDDPLLLINVFESLSDINVTVIHDSIDILHQCLFDPVIQMMDTAKFALIKIFTNYYAKTELALPSWYFEQLCLDQPGSFALQSLLFLAKSRPNLIDVIRLKSSLVSVIQKYFTTHDYELVIADLLSVLVNPNNGDDAFEYWFPENGAKHYFILSNDPDIQIREKALSVIYACSQFEQSISHFHRIDEFAGLLEGTGCSDLRIKIAQKLSSYNAFEVAFGEQTTRKWQSAKAGAIEVYDPDVVTMEM